MQQVHPYGLTLLVGLNASTCETGAVHCMHLSRKLTLKSWAHKFTPRLWVWDNYHTAGSNLLRKQPSVKPVLPNVGPIHIFFNEWNEA